MSKFGTYKSTLGQIEPHVTPKTPVEALIPSRWLQALPDETEGYVWVQICFVENDDTEEGYSRGRTVHFTTTQHGRSKPGLDPEEIIEVKDGLLLAKPIVGSVRVPSIRGVSIE